MWSRKLPKPKPRYCFACGAKQLPQSTNIPSLKQEDSGTTTIINILYITYLFVIYRAYRHLFQWPVFSLFGRVARWTHGLAFGVKSEIYRSMAPMAVSQRL